MRFMYGAADEKYIPLELHKVVDTYRLNTYKFQVHEFLQGKSHFNRNDVPIQFKVSPDTLLNLASIVVDAIALPSVYEWTNVEICRWLRRYGYPQYQNTFKENLINGGRLLLLDATALSNMNIKDFDHIKHIAYGIRSLFYFEMTKFSRSISLPPEYYYELYKLFRVKHGFKYEDVRRTDLWRKLQLIREKQPNLCHWELLERWLAMERYPKYPELIGGIPRHNLYTCKRKPLAESELHKAIPKKVPKCNCIPPCECYWDESDVQPPSRFTCLPYLKPDNQFKLDCPTCMPPCTCQWTSKKYMTNTVLSCLQNAFPTKYGPQRSEIKYSKFQGLTKSIIARYTLWEA